MRASCKGCRYLLPVSVYCKGLGFCCHYMLITGKKRESPAENCLKKEYPAAPEENILTSDGRSKIVTGK